MRNCIIITFKCKVHMSMQFVFHIQICLIAYENKFIFNYNFIWSATTQKGCLL